MNNSTKTAIACAAAYAVVGFNTLGFKYHHPSAPLPEDNEWHRREARAMNAGAAAVFWPVYWPARWSMQFWAPPAQVTVTNTVYVTNTVERPNFGHMTLPNVPTNYWHEYHYIPGDAIRWTNSIPDYGTIYPSITWSNSVIPLGTTNLVLTNGILRYIGGSNITINFAE